MKKCLDIFMKHLGNLAVFTVVISNNTTCLWFIHQPEIPSSVKELKYKNLSKARS